MFHLIVMVISLALMAMVLAANMNHISAYAVERLATQSEMHRQFSSLEQTVSRYFDDQRNVDGDILYPGDNVDIRALVSPDYGFIPTARAGMGWDLRTGTVYGLDAVAICAAPLVTLTTAMTDALSAVASQLPEGSAFLNSSCGATSTAADNAQRTHLTYWVVLLHIN